mmetsp:Transcript_12715/g.41092  ORF Transcript_12715/g.41092 Transcript_12715/m.41092 type:complete len:213 (-) Transcript_12715:1393-2031(-)
MGCCTSVHGEASPDWATPVHGVASKCVSTHTSTATERTRALAWKLAHFVLPQASNALSSNPFTSNCWPSKESAKSSLSRHCMCQGCRKEEDPEQRAGSQTSSPKEAWHSAFNPSRGSSAAGRLTDLKGISSAPESRAEGCGRSTTRSVSERLFTSGGLGRSRATNAGKDEAVEQSKEDVKMSSAGLLSTSNSDDFRQPSTVGRNAGSFCNMS